MPEMIAAELARHLGISPTRVTQYNKIGALDKAKRGMRRGRQLYDSDVAKSLLKKRQDPNYTKNTPQARYRNKKKKDGENGDGSAESIPAGPLENDSFLQWRTYTEQYKAAEKKLDYEIKSKKYILRRDVERVLFVIGRQLRESLLNAPARTAALVAAKSKKNQEEIYQILLKQSELTLKDISNKIKTAI